MSTTYTTQFRVLLCQRCGAPLQSAATGGLVTCGYCDAQNLFASRNDETPFQPPTTSASIDENERIRRLRMQDGTPMIPPASILPLLDLEKCSSSASSAKPSRRPLVPPTGMSVRGWPMWRRLSPIFVALLGATRR